MRFFKSCLFGLVGMFLLAAPAADALPDPFLAEGFWWMESRKIGTAWVLGFDAQALGSFEVQGYGVSTPQQDAFVVEYDDGALSGTPVVQRLRFDERARIAESQTLNLETSTGTGTLTITRGKLTPDKERLTLDGTISLNGMPPTTVRMRGVRLKRVPLTPVSPKSGLLGIEDNGAPITTGRTADGRLRGVARRRSFSRKIDMQVLFQGGQFEGQGGFPAMELLLGGPADLEGVTTPTFACQSICLRTPRGRIVGVTSLKNPFDRDADFLRGLTQNATVTGRYIPARNFDIERRPRLKVEIRANDDSFRFRVSGKLLRIDDNGDPELEDVSPGNDPPTVDPLPFPLRIADGNRVTITGSKFFTGTTLPTVTVGGLDATNVVVDPNGTSISFDIPAPIVPLGTLVPLTVTNPDLSPFPRGATTIVPDFFEYAIPPTVTAPVLPLRVAAGNNIVIGGMDFVDVDGMTPPDVLFDGTPGTNVIVAPDGLSLTVDVPTGTVGTFADVTVTNNPDRQSDTSTNHVEYVRAPTVNPIVSPILGSAGQTILITGTNFDDTVGQPDVFFGGAPGTNVQVGPNGASLTVVVPPGVTGTVVDITVVNQPDLQFGTGTAYFQYQ